MWHLLTTVLAASSCPAAPADTCAPWPENLERVMKTLEALPAPRQTGTSTPWNPKAPPRYLDLVDSKLQLNSTELNRLNRLGFVVLGRSSEYSYVTAYHELYQSQLPILVTADSVLHGIFRSHDKLLQDLETGMLLPALTGTVTKLRLQLDATSSQYPKQAAKDVGLYLEVAAELLAQDEYSPDGKVKPRALSPEAAVWVKDVHEASGISRRPWAGGTRLVDFSMFRVRGHYEDVSAGLSGYFLATMWLSRVDFVVAYHTSGLASDRELQAALVLAELVEKAGVSASLARIERVTTTFVGARTDIAPARLRSLATSAGASFARPHVAGLLEKLTAEPHVNASNRPTDEGDDSHPYTTALLSGRKLADTEALTMLVNHPVPNRPIIHADDVGYVLGHDAALGLLQGELAQWPGLREQLTDARKKMLAPPTEQTLYTKWLTAIGSLSNVPAGALPSFMKTPAFANLRMASAITAYGQLKHNNVLYVDEAYEEGGCEVPDGYVEPALATWEALIEYARLGRTAISSLGGEGDEWQVNAAKEHFAATERVLIILRNLTRLELANQPLPQDAKIFLSLIVEQVRQDLYRARSCPPAFNGWYFSLLYGTAQYDGAGFLASTMTSSDTQGVAYLGAREPRFGLFVVDTGGAPRVMVGPVASPFEHEASADKRLADSDLPQVVSTLPEAQRWETSYLVPAAKGPDFRLACTEKGCDASSKVPQRVKLLFHGFHREVLGAVELQLSTTPIAYELVSEAKEPARGVKLISAPAGTEQVTVIAGEQRVQTSLSGLVGGLYVIDGAGLRFAPPAEQPTGE